MLEVVKKMTVMDTKRATTKCIATALVCQLAQLHC